MKKLLSIISLMLSVVLLLASCGKQQTGGNGNGGTAAEINVDFEKEPDEMFTERDGETAYDAASSVSVTLNGDSALSSSDAAAVNGSRVTLKSEGTYVISGTLSDGMIIVDAGEQDKVRIVLNGASITSATCAPIYILNADKVFITLAKDSENTLENGGSFEAIDENNIDAVIFSKQDLTVNGEGSLNVVSPAGHGIVSKDDLVITGGTYTVNAASHAIDANDSVRVKGAALALTSGKDGIHAENSDDTEKGFVYIEDGSFTVSAEGDGISASAYMQINGGSFDIVAGGGSENASKPSSDGYGKMPGGMGGMVGHGGRPRSAEYTSSSTSESTDDSTSMKAIKAGGSLLINGGSFITDSADDAIHSNTSVVIAGGSFEIKAGDDAFHADEALQIKAGSINITESYEGLEALSVEILGGDIKIVASDDGINAAGGNDQSGFGGMRPGGDMFGGGASSSSSGSIVISGGSVYMNASGDGIDANGTFSMSGGSVTVCGPTTGDTAVLDYDRSATISGGTFIGTGAAQMAQTFSSAEQGVISVSVGNQLAGTQITLTDKDGKTLISDAPKLSFAIVILSSPNIVKGEEYTLTVGSDSETFEAE